MTWVAKRALITGITGQDGSYLTELLVAKGYQVHGVLRRASLFNTDRIDHLYHDPHQSGPPVSLHYGDLSDGASLRQVLETVQPDEIYNLGAQSHVRVSFQIPEYTADVAGLGALRMLEALREHVERSGREVRFYQAGSSEMFGAASPPQLETTPFHPRSPYGVSKAAAHWYSVNYREAYGLFVCNGILFNHESPRRGETFVTRKVTRAATRIKLGLQDRLYLGNMDARRDWGFAGDYVEAMWRMLQHEVADDFVIATGESHSVRELVEYAGELLGYKLEWKGKGLEEKGIDARTGKVLVEIDPRYFRPAEVDFLLGDASKAKKILGWEPEVKFKDLIKLMIEAEFEELGLDAKDYTKESIKV